MRGQTALGPATLEHTQVLQGPATGHSQMPGEGLNKSPLLVSITALYLTATRFLYLAAFDQVYTISILQ